MLLLDTSFFIEFEDELVSRKTGAARAVLANHRRQAVAISIITLGEFAEDFEDPNALMEFLGVKQAVYRRPRCCRHGCVKPEAPGIPRDTGAYLKKVDA
jgi:hypothetical protein